MKTISDKTGDLLSQLADSMIQDLDLDKELVRDCFPLKKPYRNQASEALLTLETRMKKKLKLKRSRVGIDIIDDAQRIGVFKVKGAPGEEHGVGLLFRGTVLGIRNVLGHNKPKVSKEETIKIILLADYLLKLFENQCKKNKIKVS